MLKLYNTLTRKKEGFKPILDKKVGFYVCGPTVYEAGHLGHARTYTVFDVIRRWLEESGYNVKFISNITDVHDDIIKKAESEKTNIKEISDKFTNQFFKELEALKIKPADKYPRVSEYIPQIIKFVKKLIEKDYAYEKNGSVYFDVSKFKNYGKLSRRKLEKAKPGTRVDIDKYEKEQAADFALWKKAGKDDEAVGASWDSPWGKGRPGWHIECSVMSKELLGEQFDIHAGARDLIFPHHENEISQSEALTGKSPFVKYWLHSGLLTIKGQKMSKSLGNFITIKDILEKYDPSVIRFWILTSHYRSPLDYSEKALEQAKVGLNRINRTFATLTNKFVSKDTITTSQEKHLKKLRDEINSSIKKSLDNDFNTPEALANIFKFIKKINKFTSKNKLSEKDIFALCKTIVHYLDLFGINDLTLEEILFPKEIQALANKRKKLRQAGDYKEADEIRKEIEKKGYTIEDMPKGTRILRAPGQTRAPGQS